MDALPLDRLSGLLERFPVRAQLFHTGPLCGVTSFAAEPGRGFLHVLRAGEMDIAHHKGSGLARRMTVTGPALLFYPQPLTHHFHNAPVDGGDFTCASVHFAGGQSHPLVRALPALVLLPLERIAGLDTALGLLFAEADGLRCGQRLLVDRLFEVVLLQMLRWLLDHPADSGIATGLLAGLCDPALARTLTALHERPGEDWNLDAMAQLAGMSRSAFAVHFKEVLGTTPAIYLADWRMHIAQAMLRKGRAVKLIADELGYANASALSRVFAQRVGASPRAWLEQNAV
ncbi:MAG: AraC family transcriptional regulator [Pseudomonadota bacterium]